MNKEEFSQYLFSGTKVKIDKINEILVEDIKQNNKEAFLEKWSLFLLKEFKLEDLRFTKIWSNLIENNHTDWLKNCNLPMNKNSYCIIFASKKYYLEVETEAKIKNREVLYFLFNQISKTTKSTVFKEFEALKNYVQMSVYEKEEEKCRHYLSVILEIDNLYRSLKPQNPDKFLTQMIITQGKEIEVANYVDGYKQPLINHNFFNEVTIKLIERLIDHDGMGANKLNNKKDSQSLNDIYHFFKKYYMYNKFEKMLNKFPEKEKTKKLKI